MTPIQEQICRVQFEDLFQRTGKILDGMLERSAITGEYLLEEAETDWLLWKVSWKLGYSHAKSEMT